MAEVFISYANANREKVFGIVDDLRALDIDCWIDKFQIPGGVPWSGEITRGIKECILLVVMASGQSLASENVRNEIGLAAHYGKRILPLMIEEPLSYPDELALILHRVQYIVATGEFASWKDRLIDAFRLAGVMVPDASSAGVVAVRARPAIRVSTSLQHLLANRHQQERRFLEELNLHLDTRPHRPAFFVLHGEHSQCIDAFISRLKLYTLPRHLARLQLVDQVEWKHIPWRDPIADPQADAQQRMLEYRADVRLELDLTTADFQALARRIADFRKPVVFFSIANGEKWLPALPSLLRDLSEFWSQLPDGSKTQPLIVILGIRRRQEKRSAWFVRRSAPIQAMIAAAIGELATANLQMILLPELTDVSMTEVEDWVRGVMQPSDPEGAIRQIKQAFLERRLAVDQKVPMETLLPMLKSVLPGAETLRGT
jgi:hypothetical protein